MYNFELHLKEGPHLAITYTGGPPPQELKNIDLKRIPWDESLERLKQLAACGTISYQGKRLIVDLFSKIGVKFEVSKEEGNVLKLNGQLQLKEPISLDRCTFLAPCQPSWFIFQSLLKVIDPEVSWQNLTSLPRLIDLEECREMSQELKLHCNFEGALKRDPMPILYLTDRLGAFANLFMDYGDQKLLPFPKDPQESSKNREMKSEEHWEQDLLETGFVRKKVDGSNYFCPLDKVGKSLAFLLEMGWKIFDAKKNQILLETKRELFLEEEKSQLGLKGKLEFSKFTTDLTKVFGSFNRRERFIDLGEGKMGLLFDQDPLATLAQEVEIVGGRAKLPMHNVGLLEPIADSWNPSPHLKSLLHQMPGEMLPSDLFQGTLRPYQQKGLDWLNTLYQMGMHGILSDEMGLGKTVQVIAFLSTLKKEARHLIVVPTSLLFNWKREIERFFPSALCLCHQGPNRSSSFEDFPFGVILTSYHTLRSDIHLFHKVGWECIILDEAQAVKNPASQTAQALYQLKSRFRLAMTGTLIENHAKELWAHFYFLMPGMLGDQTSFEQNLALTQVDSRYVRKIQKMIAPFILRRKKQEVAQDLPPLEEQTVWVDMTVEQREAYETFLALAHRGLIKKIQQDGTKKHRMEIFETLLRLRQIACHPLLVSHLLEKECTTCGKLDALWLDLETIQEEGKKALIYSQFASMLHLIAKKLQEQNIPYCLLEGATVDREAEVNRFQSDPSVPFSSFL